MRILFLSYWGVNEGLSAATVIPHLKILSSFPEISKIIFCSIERTENETLPHLGINKVIHVPLKSEIHSNVFLNKYKDFTLFPKIIGRLCDEHKIDLLICRSSLAGALGFLVSRKKKIPFVVESFEPHGLAMLESKVWRRWDPRYLIQLFFESGQKKKADFILPVSYHYAHKLVSEGVSSSKIITVPCCLSVSNFAFDEIVRRKKRLELGFTNEAVVGIYVGKFGGIYYDEEAFNLYRQAFSFFGDAFRLIILSADDHNRILQRLARAGIPDSKTVVRKTTREEVKDYLSAADFAFSTIKRVPSRLYCSPIKDGEYWANGLPVLLEPGIGDDSDIIAKEGGGVLLNMQDPTPAFASLMTLLSEGRKILAERIQAIAQKHRRMELVTRSYEQMINYYSTRLKQ